MLDAANAEQAGTNAAFLPAQKRPGDEHSIKSTTPDRKNGGRKSKA